MRNLTITVFGDPTDDDKAFAWRFSSAYLKQGLNMVFAGSSLFWCNHGV
jgi:hypothetical protein